MKKTFILLLILSTALFSFAQETTEQNLAFEYFRNADYEKAAGLFYKLYDKSPTAVNYRYLYNSLLYIRQYDELEKLVKKNIKKNPDNPSYLVDLGYFHIQQGNVSK